MVRAGLCGLLAAVPLVYSGWVTVYLKWFALDLGLAGLLAIRAWQWASGARPRPIRFQLLAPGVAGLGASVLASLGASNPWWALVALYHLGHALALYVLVADLVAERRADAGLLWSMLLAGGVASLMGLYQFLVPGSFAGWGVGGRFQAGAGNTNYAAAYLLTVLGPTLGVAIGGRLRAERWAAGGLAALHGVSLVLTNARAAWLSALVGGCGTAAALLWTRSRGAGRLSGRRALRLGVAAFGAMAVLGTGSALLRTKGHTLPERLMTLSEFTDPSLLARLSFLRDTARMIGDHPLFGVGPGHYQVGFPPYTRLADEAILKGAIAEHPHNEYLGILAESGLLGFAALLWVLGRVGRLCRDALRRSEGGPTRPLAGGLLAGLLCLGSYGLFMFPFHVAEALVNAIVILGILEGLWSGEAEGASARHRAAGTPRGGAARPWSRAGAATLTGLVTVEAAALATLSFGPLMSEASFRLGEARISAGAGRAAAQAFERSVAWFPGNFHAAFQAAGVLFDARAYAESLAWAERSLAGNRNYLLAFGVMGAAHLARGERAEAAAVFKRALAVNPGYTTALNNLGALHLEQGRPAEARPLFARAIAAHPTRAHAYVNLALLEWRDGHVAEGLALLRRAALLEPSLSRAWYYLASLSALTGKADEALSALSRAVSVDRAWAQRAVTDGNFAGLRATARFREIVGQAPDPARARAGGQGDRDP
jgi:O-antigen ligase/Tfp pilus assembly protein PilF